MPVHSILPHDPRRTLADALDRLSHACAAQAAAAKAQAEALAALAATVRQELERADALGMARPVMRATLSPVAAKSSAIDEPPRYPIAAR